MQKIPVTGLVITVLIVAAALYLSSQFESYPVRFIILFAAVFFVISAFVGLSYEGRIASRIIQAGYIDRYVAEHHVGNRETFTALVQTLKKDGYAMNPGVEKLLWEEVKRKTGYRGYQTSV